MGDFLLLKALWGGHTAALLFLARLTADRGEGGQQNKKFAGPCAQGVLDPLISHVPFWFLQFNLDKDHPGEHRP